MTLLSIALAALLSIPGSSTSHLDTPRATAAIAPACVTAPIPVNGPNLTLNITPNQTMTVTGSGYPPNTDVTITLKNLNTSNSLTITKQTDNSGNLTPGGTSQGTITASPGDVIQASTPAPNEASTTAVVPGSEPEPNPSRNQVIEILLRILEIIIPG
ncbi:MAG: hypothetical protein NXI31_15950 [bacterium]|nr:hypothetical protein [bacterium]